MIVNIDPGVTTAVAIFSGPSPAVTSIEDPKPADAIALAEWSIAAAAERGEDLVWHIEDQYLEIKWVKVRGRMVPKVNFESLIELIRRAEIFAVVAAMYGIRTIRTRAKIWQSKMLATAPKTKAGKKLSTKARATIVVAANWTTVLRFVGVPDPATMKVVKVSRLNEHIRDAILMGRWLQLFGGFQ